MIATGRIEWEWNDNKVLVSLHDLVGVWVGRVRQERLVTFVSYSCAKMPEDVQFENIPFQLVVDRDSDVLVHFDLLLSALGTVFDRWHWSAFCGRYVRNRTKRYSQAPMNDIDSRFDCWQIHISMQIRLAVKETVLRYRSGFHLHRLMQLAFLKSEVLSQRNGENGWYYPSVAAAPSNAHWVGLLVNDAPHWWDGYWQTREWCSDQTSPSGTTLPAYLRALVVTRVYCNSEERVFEISPRRSCNWN